MHLHILVEGYTEEVFVNETLKPFFKNNGIYTTPIIISTKKLRDGTKFKGGLSKGNFSSFISDLKKLIHSTPHGIVTTLIDYYKLPTNFPSYYARAEMPTQIDKVVFLESEFMKSLGSPGNFIPYIQLHEFEAFLFSSKIGFSLNVNDTEKSKKLGEIVEHFGNPEDINEDPSTAPSKRILAIYPEYNKVVDGNLIIGDIGIETIRNKCPHFCDWINKIIGRKV